MNAYAVMVKHQPTGVIINGWSIWRYVYGYDIQEGNEKTK